jgi:hypothetical protein
MNKTKNMESALAYWKTILPYGKWTCADGRKVLFNRDYTPILQRLPDGRVTPADPTEWVPWITQEWFYEDVPRCWLKRGPSKRLLDRVNAAVSDWNLF